MSVLTKLKNKVKTNYWFWKFRHFIHHGVWENYLANSNASRRFFYSEFVKKYGLTTIFEFGCASGPNLKNIIDHTRESNFTIVGFDINKAAIRMAKRYFRSNRAYFTTDLNHETIIGFLNENGAHEFDLAIYDRVLYLLTDEQVKQHFGLFGRNIRYVIIDDFHNHTSLQTNGAYSTKNYKAILSECGFQEIDISKSEHIAKEPFFEQNAHRLIFERRSL